MPSKRAKGDRLLEQALEALARALTESRVPWTVIGGIAVIARGVRRFTTDIDVAVRGDAVSAEALLHRVRAPMCTAESLVVFKAIAGRPKDTEDAEALLVLYPDIDRSRVRSRVAELAALAEAAEMLDGLDEMLKRV